MKNCLEEQTQVLLILQSLVNNLQFVKTIPSYRQQYDAGVTDLIVLNLLG